MTCVSLTVQVLYALKNVLPISLSFIIGPKLVPPLPYPRSIFLKIESLHAWVIGQAPTKYEVDWLNTFCTMLLTYTDTHTHTHTQVIATLARFNNNTKPYIQSSKCEIEACYNMVCIPSTYMICIPSRDMKNVSIFKWHYTYLHPPIFESFF